MTRISISILTVGVLVTLGFLVSAGSPGKVWWWLLFVAFGAWTALPFAGTGWFARSRLCSPKSRPLVLVASLILTGTSSAALLATFGGTPDAQGGLVFLFLPVWQAILLTPFVGIVCFLERPRDTALAPASAIEDRSLRSD